MLSPTFNSRRYGVAVAETEQGRRHLLATFYSAPLGAVWSGLSVRKLKQKGAPLPSVLSTPMRPPWASDRELAKRQPKSDRGQLPPRGRFTCSNFSDSRVVTGIEPGPSSCTVKRTHAVRGVAPRSMRPSAGVNFRAFPTRLNDHAPPTPGRRDGELPGTAAAKSRPLIRPASDSSERCDQLRCAHPFGVQFELSRLEAVDVQLSEISGPDAAALAACLRSSDSPSAGMARRLSSRNSSDASRPLSGVLMS